MADTQLAPATPESNIPGYGPAATVEERSVSDAAEAFLGLLDPQEDTPEDEEAAPTEVEESNDHDRDESAEEEETLEASDDAEEGSNDEADDEAEEEPEDELYNVKIDGEEYEVNLAELQAGYSRNSSFTKKSMALSEQRKAFEEHTTQFVQERDAIQNERQQMYAALENMLQSQAGNFEKFTNVNWEQLRDEDPVQWMTLREEQRESQEKVHAARFQQEQLTVNYQAEQKRSYDEMMEREKLALHEKMPEYFEPETSQKLGQDLISYAKSEGWSAPEIDGLVNHKHFLALHKAMLYDQLKSTDVKSKKVKGKPRVARAGKGVSKKEVTKKQRADSIDKLQRTGGIKEAANAFEALLT
tara:strand:+ start:2387 stop:3460 length:1074 start_codon:yes stop_codon:yes gene_type:complete